MTWLWWVLGLLAAGVVIDRLAVWAERRGWIYWRSRRAESGGGGPFHDVFTLFQPSHQHVVEEQDRQRTTIVRPESGEPVAGLDLDAVDRRSAPRPPEHPT